jgi:hypothetical protein
MVLRQIQKEIKHIRMKPDGTNFIAAAGTTAVTSDSADVLGFNNICFEMAVGAIVSGAVTSAKLQWSDDNSTFTDVTGGSVTIADTDDNKIIFFEVHKPKKRYFRIVTSRATQNATVDFLDVKLWNATQVPVTQDATTVEGGIFLNGGS